MACSAVPPDELRAICDWTCAEGAWRIVDEIYFDLGHRDAGGRRPWAVLAFDNDAPSSQLLQLFRHVIA
jgi:aspartate/methionine/tyrosine aminotransferase